MLSRLFSKEESFCCFPNLYLLDKLSLFFQIEITIRSLYITHRFVRKSIYLHGMRRNFYCNLFQRFVQIFGRSGRSLSTLNYYLYFQDFQKKYSFGGKRRKSFYCSNSFLFRLKKSSNQVIPSYVVHILLW